MTEDQGRTPGVRGDRLSTSVLFTPMSGLRRGLRRTQRTANSLFVVVRGCLRSLRLGVRLLGRCPICDATSRSPLTAFVLTGDSIRESLQCVRCHSNTRNRAMMRYIMSHRPDWRDADIFEAGAGSQLTVALSDTCPHHVPSQLLPDVPAGESREGFRSEDLERLTLDTDSVDLVLTEDVMEHVFHPQTAFQEIARVLRPGGVHVFTIPFHSTQASSTTRAAIDEGGVIEHLMPPEYHGDPLSEHGVLVVTDFGRDLPTSIAEWCGMETRQIEVEDSGHGIPEPCTVFVSTNN